MSASSGGGGPVRLSRREMEIARLVAEGLTNRDIATRLFLSERTVDGHLEHVREKLGVNTRAQVATWVTRLADEAPAAVAPQAQPPSRTRALRRISKRWWVTASAVLLVIVEAVVVLQVIQSQGPTIITVAGLDPGPKVISGDDSGDGGPAINAAMNLPSGVAISSDGFYIADYGNRRVRFVDRATRRIKAYAGGGTLPLVNGNLATSVKLGAPSSVAVDRQGRLYILTNESQDLQVWTVDAASRVQKVTQLPPSRNEPAGYFPDLVGGLAIASDGTMYITDLADNRIWRYSPGSDPKLLAGTGQYGYSGDPGPALTAMLDSPSALALDEKRGYLYFADTGNNCIRRISLHADVITRFAGSCPSFGNAHDGGQALQAQLSIPFGVAVGGDGTVFIADTGNYRLREVKPDGTILALAGTGVGVFFGDGVPATQAAFRTPTALAIDRATGDLFVVDTVSQRVRALIGVSP